MILKNKKAQALQNNLIQIILIGLILILFVTAITSKSDSRSIKQQVLEKQTALLIDSAIPDTDIILEKANLNGAIQDIKINKNHILITIDGLVSLKGHYFFTKYKVEIIETKSSFIIQIR